MSSGLTDIVVIYNPNSTGPSEEKAKQLLDDLRHREVHLPMQLLATQRAGHAIEMAFDAAKRHRRPLIVASSGDGGYNEVINGALRAQSKGADPVCAVLPAGNANDHRRSVARGGQLCDAIASQRIERIDVLKTTTRNGSEESVRYAHSYVGLGISPAVAVELNKTSLNRWRESLIVAKSFRDFEPVEMIVDGKRQSIDSLLFANVEQMAKVLKVARNARVNDGEFKVINVRHRSKAHLAFAILQALVGGLRGVSAKCYSFEAVAAMTMQCDGEVVEIASGSTVNIDIQPRFLSTIR